MSLRDKTLLILFVAIVALGGLLYHFTQSLFLQSYYQADKEQAYNDLMRLERGILSSIQQLKSVEIQGSDLESIRKMDSSSTPEADWRIGALQSIGVEYVAIFESDGNIEALISILGGSPERFEAILHEKVPDLLLVPELRLSRDASGILHSEGNYYLCSLKVVSSSDNLADITKYVFLAQRADQSYFDRLRQLSGAAGRFRPIDSELESLAGFEMDGLGRDRWLDERDDKLIFARRVMLDIFSAPSFLLEVGSARDNVGYGMAILGYFTFFLILCGIILGCVIFFLLEKNFFKQLSRLRYRFSQAETERFFESSSGHVSNNEILNLSDDFDSVLAALDDAAKKITGSENRFKELFNSIKCGVEIYDINEETGELCLEEFNSAAERFSGLTADQIKGLSIDQIYPDLRHTILWPAIESVCSSDRPVNVDPFLYDNENLHGWREYEIYKLPSAKVVLLHYDVTARMEIAEALREKEIELSRSQKMEAVGRLAGGVAHDFNNILTIVNGISEILLLTMDENDEHRHDIQEINNAGQKAAKLTSQLLAFSRKQAMKPEVVDINRILSGIKTMLRRVLGDNIELKIVNTASSSLVLADAGQIEQVILNLTINARDAMPDGGYLEIDISKERITSEYIAKHATFESVIPKTGQYVVIRVVDNGAGMSDEVVQRVFDPFFSTKAEGRGTGLGLSTSYGIISQSKGYMWFQSKVGVGTTCTICLPHEDMAKSIQKKDKGARLPIGRERVLLVEDSADLRNLMHRFLEEVGFKVFVAANADDALDINSNFGEEIDILLADVVMPGANGFDLFKRIRKVRPKIKVVFITGHYDEAIVNDKIAGNYRLLKKPFAMLELAEAIRAEIDKHGNSTKKIY